MSKNLSSMTLSEMWKLFPIQLTEHKVSWKDWYQSEEKHLMSVLPEPIKIHHVGSTSINNIWAKPIIDILIESDVADHEAIKDILLVNGYRCIAENEASMDFNKGYTPDGFAEKVFHLHLRAFGDHNELYFRDYLNDHPEIAKKYEVLKLSLWKKFEHDRDGYTESKSAFIREYTQKAIKKYGKVY